MQKKWRKKIKKNSNFPRNLNLIHKNSTLTRWFSLFSPSPCVSTNEAGTASAKIAKYTNFISAEFLKSLDWLKKFPRLAAKKKTLVCLFSFSIEIHFNYCKQALQKLKTGWRTFQSINEWMIYATFDVDTKLWKCSFSCFACFIASVVSVNSQLYVRLNLDHVHRERNSTFAMKGKWFRALDVRFVPVCDRLEFKFIQFSLTGARVSSGNRSSSRLLQNKTILLSHDRTFPRSQNAKRSKISANLM